MKSGTLHRYLSQGYQRRKFFDFFMRALLACTVAIAVLPLGSVLTYVLQKGLPALNWSFFTSLPKPVGELGGGMANALVGTLILVSMASTIGILWGGLIGIYLSEFGRGKLATTVRFAADLLGSVPSIVIGLFVYTVIVMPMKRFSAIAGAVALGILMIPTVARSTEELLRLVPQHIREAGLALGLPRWKVTLFLVIRGALSGIITGVLLAVARVAGETAPLLFTALGNQHWHSGIDQPMASLPVQIYTYAISPFEEWHRMAWAGALVLVGVVFTMNLLSRFLLRGQSLARE